MALTAEELKKLISTGSFTNNQTSALVKQAQGELWDGTDFDSIGGSDFFKQHDALGALEGTGTTEGGGMFDNILGDQYKMGNITGLASTLMQAAALPSMLKAAKLQNQSAQHNLDTAKAEQARRNKNIKGFNAPVSAFV